MYFKTEETRERALSKLKIGKNNAIKTGIIMRKNYESSPKKCLECDGEISYFKRDNSFCSRSCSASYNNKNKEIKEDKKCKNCSKTLIGIKRQNKFCGNLCFNEYKSKKSFELNLDNFNAGLLPDEKARVFFRKITRKVCSICHLEKWNESPIPLEVDHIDGNSNNNFPSNLRFICCNCAALLPTYKGGNKGKGREYRRKK